MNPESAVVSRPDPFWPQPFGFETAEALSGYRKFVKRKRGGPVFTLEFFLDRKITVLSRLNNDAVSPVNVFVGEMMNMEDGKAMLIEYGALAADAPTL